MFRILLAEDNPGDVLLFREALRAQGLACELLVAEDGHKALALLEDVSNEPVRSLPHLIVLDVNLPKYGGDEVLRRIRAVPVLAAIPVIMLTSSASPVDLATATKLGANLYIQKSSNLDELLEVGKVVEGMLKSMPPGRD